MTHTLPKNCKDQLKADRNHICLACLEEGNNVHLVYALGFRSHLTTYRILGKPYMAPGIGWFIDGMYHSEHLRREIRTEFSLKDCNVITNHYNQHKLFREEEDAQQYVKLCLGRVTL